MKKTIRLNLNHKARLIVALTTLIKVKQTLLLLASSYASYLLGGGLTAPLSKHILLLVLGFLAIASTTAVNMYFDRDIDAVMERTKHRPLAMGIFNPELTLILALTIFVLSTLLSAIYINMLFATTIVVGFLFNIVAYTMLLKRRTPFSIIAGAIAGGMPSLGGWVAATNRIDSAGLALSMLVVAWVPSHIWFLAYYRQNDYAKAKVPMLPTISDPLIAGLGIALASVFQAYSLLILVSEHVIGLLTAFYGLLSSTHLFILSMQIAEKKNRRKALRAFKYTNLHLAVIYALMLSEKIMFSYKHFP
ncbi:MAG TPA: protoheme IX farnesyltransferase [Pyrodictium sp.]|nr:protoheme IX farnesyltransferase [Pyrodictium sp.]